MENLPASEGREITGGCFCKAVTFCATGPWSVQCCHCNLCRHAIGGAFTWNVVASDANFKFTGEKTPENGGVISFASSDKINRINCAKCGCYVVADAHGYKAYGIPIGVIDGIDSANEVPEFLKPQRHVFYADRITDVNDSIVKHDAFPAGV